MAIPSRQIGWGTESNLLWQILKQLTRLTSTLFSLKEAATPKYKVYTALLTQSGSDGPTLVIDLPLIVGVTYEIIDNDGDTADFTNVGAPNNNGGTYFVATGTTPNSWGANLLGELSYNTGAPVVTVLENTIGNIWFQYNGVGIYEIRSESLFIDKKTGVIMATPYNNGDPTEPRVYTTKIEAEYFISLYTFSINLTPRDNSLDYTFIEIRVYN